MILTATAKTTANRIEQQLLTNPLLSQKLIEDFKLKHFLKFQFFVFKIFCLVFFIIYSNLKISWANESKQRTKHSLARANNNDVTSSTASSSTSNNKNKGLPKLSTDIQFNNHQVNGKIQLPHEAMTVVEDEKVIDDLIGVRKNFTDRIKRSKTLRH